MLLQDRVVIVSGIGPGIGRSALPFATDITSQEACSTLIEAPERGVSPEMAKEQILESQMLRRTPEPEEIADAVVFFASDISRSIAGPCLDANSGQFTH